MASQFNRFKETLSELFMLDQAELDFGIYRIMNQKRTEINRYLDIDLVRQVKEVLAANAGGKRESLLKEIAEATKNAESLGIDAATLPKIQTLKAELSQLGGAEELENDVYDHLATFFKRYYDGGDFISLRRYKKDVYAIPYEGEEVKLHWANADQYYIKTSEYFRNYSFKLEGDKRVSFVLIEASTEQNNNKSQGDKERKFAIYAEKPVEIEGAELRINFTYEPTDKKTKQIDLMATAYEVVKPLVPVEFAEVFSLRATDKNKNRTLLEKHLTDYVAKNTFDYFIHKDLRGFLNRELDFYIKNEILFIDDINTKQESEFLKHLSAIKAVKAVGGKIIDFLSSLEDFQKKLWLKKKFVVEANYCITLDRVPSELYGEIVACDAQREEWVRLFAIDEIKGTKASGLFADGATVGYSVPLSVEFLKSNPYLVLDTAFFDASFRQRLLSSIDNFDEQLDGTLINSENFQALNLLQEKYQEQVKCIYTDPPYNTGSDGFRYKDHYKHSSWLSMMQDRLMLAKETMTEDSSIYMSINENEAFNLEKLSNYVFGEDMYLTSFAVKVRHEDRILKGDKDFHEVYETLFAYRKTLNHKTLKRIKDNTSNSEYIWSVDITIPDEIIEMGNKQVEVYYPKNYEIRQNTPNFMFLKRISVRGSIKEGNSSGRFYTANIEQLSDEYANCIFKVPNMGDDESPYRFFWKPSIESKRINGDYFQGVPLNRKDELEIPFPNFIDMEKEFNNCVDEGGISFSGGKKPVNFVKFSLNLATKNRGNTILDFFAGSGTTGHAVIDLNREDEGKRKYILIEMGTYFDTITKPRIQKVIYSKDWKDGKPVSRTGSSHCFKYLRLEQYEDTLNNLTVKQTHEQKIAFDTSDTFRESFLLGYMLDTETQDSLLSADWFINPFAVSLNITRQNEMQQQKIDIVETFNYLIGLNVTAIAYPKDGICTVTGTTRRGEHSLIIWRDCNKIDNEALNGFFTKSAYSTRDNEFDRIYINGDNNLENLRTDEDHWKVVLTEEEFAKRMFEQ